MDNLARQCSGINLLPLIPLLVKLGLYHAIARKLIVIDREVLVVVLSEKRRIELPI